MISRIKNSCIFGIFALGFIPSIYLGFIYTHIIVKILILLLVITHLFDRNKSLTHRLTNKHNFVFFVLFLSQSASIIYSKYPMIFFDQYKDVFIAMIFYFILATTKDLSNETTQIKLLLLFMLSLSINVFLKIFLLFSPIVFFQIFSLLFHPGLLEHIQMNLQRGRIYLDTYDEAFVPFISYLYVAYKNVRIRSSLLLLIPVIIVSIASNFRTRFIMLIFSLLGSSIILKKNIKQYVVFVLPLVIIVSFLTFLYVSHTTGNTLIDRFLLSNEIEDVNSLMSRIDKAKVAIEIGASSPVVGVGLGQMQDYLPTINSLNTTTSNPQQKTLIYDTQLPHNVFLQMFAETGLFGLISFILLLALFVQNDIKALREDEVYTHTIIVSFWTLFIYSLFNPTYNFGYILLFWSLRGLILNAQLSPHILRKSTR